MERRDFLRLSALAGAACLVDFDAAFAAGRRDPVAGKPWGGWRRGQFQIHSIYTGAGESMFLIMPDGTSLLLDCGDFNALARGKLAVPVLPDTSRHPGEWIARYVLRVNPKGRDVDYMMLSHYHSDHSGTRSFYARREERDGVDYRLSGFSLAAEQLDIHRAIDRAWPTYDDPVSLTRAGGEPDDVSGHMRAFYDYMTRHRGMRVEKFRLGVTDQVRMLSKPGAYPGFSVRNICANGRIADREGRVRDLYAERVRGGAVSLNENGMSLGMIMTYGKFKFFTAGDFSDGWNLPDGKRFEIEDALADVVEPVSVAKINHHGHHSMTPRLVAALRPRVFVNNVWDQLHTLPDVMERLDDRETYPGPRIVCPTVFPAERQAEDKGKPWLGTLDPASFEPGHVVISVERDGRYSVSYLTAKDESMVVRSVLRFEA